MNKPSLLRAIILLLIPALLLISNISLAADGKELFLKNCASCHGNDGEGGKGPALNKQGLLIMASETYFVKSIFYGRPTRGCPPRKDLYKEEVVSIAQFIKSLQKEKSVTVSDKKVTPFPSDRGKQIFAVCVGCHDTDGVGAMGPSLIDPGFLASASDAFLRGSIMYGREGTPMLGFSKENSNPNLTEEDIDELISYIRYLGIEKNQKK